MTVLNFFKNRDKTQLLNTVQFFEPFRLISVLKLAKTANISNKNVLSQKFDWISLKAKFDAELNQLKKVQKITQKVIGRKVIKVNFFFIDNFFTNFSTDSKSAFQILYFFNIHMTFLKKNFFAFISTFR